MKKKLIYFQYPYYKQLNGVSCSTKSQLKLGPHLFSVKAGMSNWRPAGIFSVPYMIKKYKEIRFNLCNKSNKFVYFWVFQKDIWLKMPL